MPKFHYKAKNSEGKIKKGSMEASAKGEVVESLRKDGYWVIFIEKSKGKEKKSAGFLNRITSVPLKNRMIFCRHLGVMVSSGLSLSRALGILATQEKNRTFKKVINEINVEVKKGVSLADAMKKYPKVFDSVFTSMIEVGEVGGNLEEILSILAEQMEKDHKLISKVRGALIYPSVIFTVMIVIGVLMMIFVVPTITQVFQDFDADLPVMTQVVLGISDFMSSNILLTLGTLVGSVAAIVAFYKTPVGRRIFHKLFLKAPVLGGIITKVNSARFARILSSLLQSGVSLVEALKITSNTLGNHYFKKAAAEASEEVQKGVTLSDILEKHQAVFPYLIVQMISVGEETGKTPDILLRLAGFYEEEVEQVTKNLSSIIEPVLMVVIGGAVGFFAIAIIQPIYSLMEAF